MTYGQRLLQVELNAFIALSICAGLFALGIITIDFLTSSETGTSVRDAMVGFGVTLMLGLPLALLYGAPLYAWLQKRKRASWVTVVLLRLSPGAFVTIFGLVTDPIAWYGALVVGFTFACGGVLVACGTHVLSKGMQ